MLYLHTLCKELFQYASTMQYACNYCKPFFSPMNCEHSTINSSVPTYYSIPIFCCQYRKSTFTGCRSLIDIMLFSTVILQKVGLLLPSSSSRSSQSLYSSSISKPDIVSDPRADEALGGIAAAVLVVTMAIIILLTISTYVYCTTV